MQTKLRKTLDRHCVRLFWGVIAAMALAMPVYSIAQSLPSAEIISKTIINSCPVDKADSCFAAADLLQAVGSFYEVVIMVLIALLAIVASLVYLSIRSASKKQIESQFEQDLQSEWFKHRIRTQVDNSTQAAMADLAHKLELLERAVSSMKRGGADQESVRETTIFPSVGGEHGAG